uniref:Reverse transcriptase, RNA-dependent DNA polymerase, Gag-polypeptide of LTR copia-type n=1 Tax=Tanacetum cinerariifolium TaxID=118510 RepID=A0A6L2LE20_TANCI|nr:reverse transcriptase, RNA-dependent DNA polymerase, Gag-polypeptide of LTR copia-type [Tanacetum cinerariifolium]
MIALNAKNKMKIIIREFTKPRMDFELRALWERNNDMLISWILNTNKMKIIIREFTKPRMDFELRALWERNNDMLISWILNTDQSRRIALDNLCDGLYFSTHHPMFLQPHPPFSTVSASLNFGTQDLVTHHTLS